MSYYVSLVRLNKIIAAYLFNGLLFSTFKIWIFKLIKRRLKIKEIFLSYFKQQMFLKSSMKCVIEPEQ